MTITAEQIVAGRRRWVDVGRFRIQIQRPTVSEDPVIARMTSVERIIHFALYCVVGWSGVTEADLLPGVGGSDDVPFDAETYRAWAADEQDVILAVGQAVLAALVERRNAVESAAGKSVSSPNP